LSTQGGEFPDDWFFGEPEQRAQHAALEGKPAPELQLEDWVNADGLDQGFEGQIVVIDFWATWCGPCITAIPKKNELYTQYKNQGVFVLGLCSLSPQEEYHRVLKEHKVTYPAARDASDQSVPAWQIMWRPTYAVVDRQGTLRALGLRPEHIQAVIEVILKEQPPNK